MAIAIYWNLRSPDAAPFILRLTERPVADQPRSRSLYPFLSYRVFTADTLRYAVMCTFDHVTLTFEPVTLNICTVSAMTLTLYHILAKSSNRQRSYCNFSIWPTDLQHVPYVALAAGIIFAKFEVL